MGRRLLWVMGIAVLLGLLAFKYYPTIAFYGASAVATAVEHGVRVKWIDESYNRLRLDPLILRSLDGRLKFEEVKGGAITDGGYGFRPTVSGSYVNAHTTELPAAEDLHIYLRVDGRAGMQLSLVCSSGVGKPDFDDLIPPRFYATGFNAPPNDPLEGQPLRLLWQPGPEGKELWMKALSGPEPESYLVKSVGQNCVRARLLVSIIRTSRVFDLMASPSEEVERALKGANVVVHVWRSLVSTVTGHPAVVYVRNKASSALALLAGE
jgi:hypothetical protein